MKAYVIILTNKTGDNEELLEMNLSDLRHELDTLGLEISVSVIDNYKGIVYSLG